MTARFQSDWWRKASRLNRLEQVSAAIEIGLTGSETATLLGAAPRTVYSFASKYSLSFAGSDKSVAYERLSAKARSKRPIISAGSFNDFSELSF